MTTAWIETLGTFQFPSLIWHFAPIYSISASGQRLSEIHIPTVILMGRSAYAGGLHRGGFSNG
jgi:hypothetical protein